MSTPGHMSDGCRDREVSSEPSAWCEAGGDTLPFYPFARSRRPGHAVLLKAQSPGKGQDARTAPVLSCSQPSHMLDCGANPQSGLWEQPGC